MLMFPLTQKEKWVVSTRGPGRGWQRGRGETEESAAGRDGAGRTARPQRAGHSAHLPSHAHRLGTALPRQRQRSQSHGAAGEC